MIMMIMLWTKNELF